MNTPPFVASPNFNTGRHGLAITHIIIHAMIGTLAGTQSWFRNPYSQVSAHYLVGRNGVIVQMVKDEDKAWHVCEANAFCLGIELEDMFEQAGKLVGGGNNQNTTTSWWTDIQLRVAAELIASKMKAYNIPVDNVIGHNDKFLIAYNNNHQDPGVLFPWAVFKAFINKGLLLS